MELTLLNNQTVISVRRNISHKRTSIRAGTQKSAHCQSNKFFHSHLILLIKTVLIIRHKSLMANIILLLLQITSSYYSCSLILLHSRLSFPLFAYLLFISFSLPPPIFRRSPLLPLPSPVLLTTLSPPFTFLPISLHLSILPPSSAAPSLFFLLPSPSFLLPFSIFPFSPRYTHPL